MRGDRVALGVRRDTRAEARIDDGMPRSPAQLNAEATSEANPQPLASSTLRGTTLASGAMPAMPCRCCACAAIVPATCVPWPFSSAGFASSPPSRSRRRSGRRDPVRSRRRRCRRPHRLSAPVLKAQASGTSMSASASYRRRRSGPPARCSAGPTGWECTGHRRIACRRASSSAYTTSSSARSSRSASLALPAGAETTSVRGSAACRPAARRRRRGHRRVRQPSSPGSRLTMMRVVDSAAATSGTRRAMSTRANRIVRMRTIVCIAHPGS